MQPTFIWCENCKFATRVNDTNGKFVAGVNDTSGNLPLVSMTPVNATDSYRHYLTTVNLIPWLWIYWKVPLSHTRTQKGKQNCVSDVSKFKSGEGGFLAQCCGNVLLWSKSDDSKKSLVLFYLFTLCSLPYLPSLLTLPTLQICLKHRALYRICKFVYCVRRTCMCCLWSKFFIKLASMGSKRITGGTGPVVFVHPVLMWPSSGFICVHCICT